MPSEQVQVPDTCLAVSSECPIEGTIYGYYPSLGWNAFFAAIFALCAIGQIGLGIRYRTWTYMIGVGLGCIAEAGGYAGRIVMHNNPYNELGFQIQIVLLIFAPAFLAAGIYLVLKHSVIQIGVEWSRVRPNWYTYIFIACDVSSLALQSAGGAIAAISEAEKDVDMGTNIMIAGIIWQVVVLVVFAAVVLEYAYRTYKRRDSLSPNAVALLSGKRFKIFLSFVFAAYITILVRCVYRIPELLEGWGGKLMRIESEFIALEGVMIVLAALAQTIGHPGIWFPAMANGGKGMQARRDKMQSVDSEVEMMDRA